MAEVLVAETSGYTKFGITPEDVRDHFDKITDRAQFIVPDGPDDFHARTFKFIVDAGAEPLETDAGADKLAVAPRETGPD